jgi:hypothetical protein
VLEISDEYIYDLSNDEKFIIIITRNKMLKINTENINEENPQKKEIDKI